MTVTHAMHTRALFWFVALSFIAGCGESTGSVKGKVFLQGKPVTAGTVAFLAPNEKVGTSQIDADGSYHIHTVPTGLAKISVASATQMTVPVGKKMDPGKMGAADKSKGEETAQAKAVSIPPQYADVKKSGLTYEVKSGPQEFDIKLP